MRRFGLFLLVAVVVGMVAAFFLARPPGRTGGEPEVDALVPAPPAAEDTAPPTGLSDVPADAVVFDLEYRPETGGKDDMPYHSFWGFGGSDTETSPFLEEVRQKAKTFSKVQNPLLQGRSHAAVEHVGRKMVAFYFDLNADGKLTENERIPPTRKSGDSVDFITPDFIITNTVEGAGKSEVKFRALLQVGFYGDGSEPNFMWSPAAVLEGAATVQGKKVQMTLFANGFGGKFDQFGASSCALRTVDAAVPSGTYVPRETLSSLVRFDGQFFRVKFEGRRSSGHVARAVLTRDTSPTGILALKLASTNAVSSRFNGLYLQGVSDKTVNFNVNGPVATIPVGSYNLVRGDVTYGVGTQQDWHVSFSGGPETKVEADKKVEVVLGQPTLEIRAIKEEDRYRSNARETAVFAKGTRIYLEPKITCQGKEVLTRFSRSGGSSPQRSYMPPTVQIAKADGKELLSQKMEYG